MFRRLRILLLRPVSWALAIVGLAVLVLGAMLASPIVQPAENPAIRSGVKAIDQTGLPEPARFQARDGTELAYRLYPATGSQPDTSDIVAILIHGSGGSSTAMNVVANALGAAGITAVSPDIRGHGLSGARGDIGYIGQLDDDIADLLAELRSRYPDAQFVLIGHSSGGGFALRIAAGPLGDSFERFVLLAPYLGPFSPTSKQPDGNARWAEPDIPRIIALDMLNRLGISCCEQLPVIAFAVAPGSQNATTSRYSYRLLSNFGAPKDYEAAFNAAHGDVAIIAGNADTLMDSVQYPNVLGSTDSEVVVQILPDINHMGVIHDTTALGAIVSTTRGKKAP